MCKVSNLIFLLHFKSRIFYLEHGRKCVCINEPINLRTYLMVFIDYGPKTAFHVAIFQNDIDSAVALTDCLTLVGQDAYHNLVTHCVDDLRV